VESAVRRNSKLFERLGESQAIGRGRPRTLWALRADARSEIQSVVTDLQEGLPPGALPSPALPEDQDRLDAVATALAALRRTIANDEAASESLSQLVNSSLRAAALDDPDPSLPLDLSQASSVAALTRSVLAVLDAERSGSSATINSCVGDAVHWLSNTRDLLPTSTWLPLAERVVAAPATVAFSPVEVVTDDEDFARSKVSDIETAAGMQIVRTPTRGRKPLARVVLVESLAQFIPMVANLGLSFLPRPMSTVALVGFSAYDDAGASLATELGLEILPVRDTRHFQLLTVRMANRIATGLVVGPTEFDPSSPDAEDDFVAVDWPTSSV
jgi:hypothetical protein